jgi:hypothetical protein
MTSIRVRQPALSIVGKLVRHFRRTGRVREWLLPGGERVEQCGERQTDLLLVWAKEDTTALDEPWLRSRWPQSTRTQQLGRN